MCSFGRDGKFCSRNEEQWSVRGTEKRKKVLMGDMEWDYFTKVTINTISVAHECLREPYSRCG